MAEPSEQNPPSDQSAQTFAGDNAPPAAQEESPSLKTLLDDGTRLGRRFELAIQIAIFISLAAFTIETLPNLSPAAEGILAAIELATVLVFTVEYVLRYSHAQPKRDYVLSFYGIIDLLAVLPFWAGLALDLRSLRILRALRLFRLLKLSRYFHAAERLWEAIYSVREAICVYLAATGLILYLASVGIYFCERDAQPEVFGSVFHCIWWAIVTLTTVGYGDAYPITLGGKIFTGLILIIALGVVAVPSGLIASALVERPVVTPPHDAPE